MTALRLYLIAHHNLAFSSIQEERRAEVIRYCYHPLLKLARDFAVPIGIEISAYTLETAAALDPDWLAELRCLTGKGRCEFIGSGYSQLIGPLVPFLVNAANQRLGLQAYERLGFRPQIALVNEQAYSSGVIQQYRDAGYRAIVMEWDNPARSHPRWPAEWRYLPQYACGQHGERLPLLWNKSIAFQKFQRYAHGEMELEEYLEYLYGHVGDRPRAFPLYGNDVEVFDFRPGRFHTEAALTGKHEWQRIGRLFEVLRQDSRFCFVRPSEVLDLLNVPGAGNALQLESAEQPVPVKKQGKYNLTRWAITGRDDLGINTACWRLYNKLKDSPADDAAWRELCYLWSSDFRTHITEKRWLAYQERLSAFERSLALPRPAWPKEPAQGLALPASIRVTRTGRWLNVEAPHCRLRLNCRRGLAIDRLWFTGNGDDWLCGTLPHGYYDDISWGADFYTGHLVFEAPGQPKITDLNQVEPTVTYDQETDRVIIAAEFSTPLGPLRKQVGLGGSQPGIELLYLLDWPQLPVGCLRLGHITLNPKAFDRESLFYRCHNGGMLPETFPLCGQRVEHDKAVSFLVSARGGIGLTEGWVEMGDQIGALGVSVDQGLAALFGMVTFTQVGDSYFYRLTLSAQEIDETSRARSRRVEEGPLACRISITHSQNQ